MIHQVKEEIKTAGDPEIARHSARFFKTGPGEYGEGDLFRGIRVPVLRRLSRTYKGLALEDVDILLHSDYHEDRLLALFIMVLQYTSGDEILKKQIFHLYLSSTEYINNWDLVDASAGHIVGAHLHGKRTDLLVRLAHSKSLWERRISIMSTFYFIRKGSFAPTFEIAFILLGDREDLIHKAVGWMLREVGKKDRDAEVHFLGKHYGRMPRTMLRYAIEKFPEEERLRYLKGLV